MGISVNENSHYSIFIFLNTTKTCVIHYSLMFRRGRNGNSNPGGGAHSHT